MHQHFLLRLKEKPYSYTNAGLATWAESIVHSERKLWAPSVRLSKPTTVKNLKASSVEKNSFGTKTDKLVLFLLWLWLQIVHNR